MLQVQTQGFQQAESLPESCVAQFLLPLLHEIWVKLPRGRGSAAILVLGQPYHSCFEIALCLITTPRCFVRYPSFINIKNAVLEMLSFDSSACLPTRGTEGKAILNGSRRLFL